MVVIAPPEPPCRNLPVDPQALFEEARRRTRRRRRRTATSALVVAVAVLGVAAWLGRPGPTAGRTSNAEFATAGARGAAHNGPITVAYAPYLDGPGGVYVARPAGRGRLLFATTAALDWPQKCINAGSVAWAPDGRHLAVGCSSFNGMVSDGLYVADARTRTSKMIRPATRHWQGLGGYVEFVDLAWSPDGSLLAFVSNASGIGLIHADGSGYRLLRTGAHSRDRGPTWSADGKRIAYATRIASGPAVFAVDLDGADRTLVATPGNWPAWSPDGRTIAYLAPCGVRLATPQGTPLSGCIGVHGAPVWSPDGRQIAMAIRGRGIYTMNADGTDLRLFTHVTPETNSAWPLNPSLRPAWKPRPRG